MISVLLSREDSYTGGNKYLEIMKADGDYSYFQIREGIGYMVYDITDKELDELSEKLISQNWRKKAEQLIARLSLEAYRERNTKKNGELYKKYKPYAIPAVAEELVQILGMHDEKEAEERAKAIFIKLGEIPDSEDD